MLSISKEYAKNITVMDLRNSDSTCVQQLETILWMLSHPDEEVNPWLKGLETVVLDSGSEFATIALESIVAKQVAKQVVKPGKPSRTIDEVWLEDYGKLTSSLLRLFRHLRDIPYHVIMTALSNSIYPDSNKSSSPHTEPVEVKPAFTKKLGESVMGYFDCVWYMYTRTVEEEGHHAKILTQPRGVYRAKTRGTEFPRTLGDTIDNPTFSTVLKALRDSEK